MYVLDTNVLSELRKIIIGRANSEVTEWFQNISHDQLYVSAISLMELEVGILSKQRKDPKQAKILRAWFDNYVLPEFANRTLNIDKEVALCCAKLHVPDPSSERDALICATALVHDMTVVTRNVKDFERSKVKIVNPFISL